MFAALNKSAAKEAGCKQWKEHYETLLEKHLKKCEKP